MSRFLVIAAFSLLAGLSVSTVQAGERVFNEARLQSAEMLDFEAQSLQADRWGRDRRDHDRYERDCRRRGDCRRPPPRPAPTRQYVCYAESSTGRVYEGRDRHSASFAQREAMDTCYAYSRRCRPLGCDYY